MRLFVNSKNKNTKATSQFVLRDSVNSPSNFIINLEQNENYKGYAINKIVFPYSFYNISSRKENKTLSVVDSTATTINVTIDDGNWNITDLIAQIETDLLAGSTDTFALTYNSKTGKVTISNSTGNFSITWSSEIYKILGFESTSLSGSSSYTSANLINVSDNVIYLCSSQLSRLQSKEQNPLGREIIEVIPLTQSFGNQIVYIPQQKIYNKICSPTRLSIMDFYLIDSDARILDLNGIDNVFYDITLIE